MVERKKYKEEDFGKKDSNLYMKFSIDREFKWIIKYPSFNYLKMKWFCWFSFRKIVTDGHGSTDHLTKFL